MGGQAGVLDRAAEFRGDLDLALPDHAAELSVSSHCERSLDKSCLPCRAEHPDLDDCLLLAGDSPGQHQEATTAFRPKRCAAG